jgi:hypothetical protein
MIRLRSGKLEGTNLSPQVNGESRRWVAVDGVLERRVLRRVHLVERCADHRDGLAAVVDRGGVRRVVNAFGEPRHDHDAGARAVTRELRGTAATLGGRLARADDRDARPSYERDVADRVDLRELEQEAIRHPDAIRAERDDVGTARRYVLVGVPSGHVQHGIECSRPA